LVSALWVLLVMVMEEEANVRISQIITATAAILKSLVHFSTAILTSFLQR
jgi:hypothetical protein